MVGFSRLRSRLGPVLFIVSLLLVTFLTPRVADARKIQRRTPIILKEDGFETPHAPTPLSAALPESLEARLAQPETFAHLDDPNPVVAAAAQSSLNCTVCEGVVTLLRPVVLKNSTETLIGHLAVLICEAIKPLCHSADACTAVCTGIVAECSQEAFEIIREWGTPTNVCAVLKQCPAVPDPTPSPSTPIPIPSNLSNLAGEIEWPSWQKTDGTGYFLHLSDVHVDQAYQVGALADCPLPSCCHATDGTGTNASNTAAFWGDYRCDTAPQLAVNLVEYISTLTPPPDFILYTGDDPAHDVWKQSREENLAAFNFWADLLNSTLNAREANIPIFATLGNHAAFPIDQFAGPGRDSWLYDAVVDAWSPHLPDDAKKTTAYGGYYQARVRPGLRIVSLNSNYFANENFWLIANKTYAVDQLNWFANVMSQASSIGEKVIVICHAPLFSWNTHMANEFLAIAEQYQSTIVNYFMGHTHFNAYTVLHTASGAPMAVQFTGGSIVPFGNVNPGFMRYEYDRATVAGGASYSNLVQRASAHWADLAEANALNNTDEQWPTLRFDLATALDVPSLDAATLALVAPQFLTNTTLFQLYNYMHYKGFARPSPEQPIAVYCTVTTNTADEFHACLAKGGLTDEQIEKHQAHDPQVC